MFSHTINHTLPGFYQQTTGLVLVAPTDISSSVFLSTRADLVTLQFHWASSSSFDELFKRGPDLCKLQLEQIRHFGDLTQPLFVAPDV